MRIERTFKATPSSSAPARADHALQCEESHYCEDAACEAEHADPTIKWDKRVSYCLGVAYGAQNAEMILAALRASAALERA